jgi:hypothetical protein
VRSSSFLSGSFGLGEFIEYIVKQLLNNCLWIMRSYGTRYLFIEIPEVLQQLQQQGLIHALADEITCTTPECWEDEAKLFKLKEYCYLRHVYEHKAICAQQANLPEYAELNWKTTEALQSLHFQYTSSLGSQTFLTRQLENIADNILPAKLLNNSFSGQTAIILAGGPSLTNILPWVKKNKTLLLQLL